MLFLQLVNTGRIFINVNKYLKIGSPFPSKVWRDQNLILCLRKLEILLFFIILLRADLQTLPSASDRENLYFFQACYLLPNIYYVLLKVWMSPCRYCPLTRWCLSCTRHWTSRTPPPVWQTLSEISSGKLTSPRSQHEIELNFQSSLLYFVLYFV